MDLPLAVEHCGRRITRGELLDIVELVERCRGLSRKELAHTVCEHLAWVTVSGRHKVTACLGLLERLEKRGSLLLPAKQQDFVRRPRPLVWTERTAERPPLCVRLGELAPVTLELTEGALENALWNEYVDRYHYLRYKRPFGFVLRYRVMSKQIQLGCVLLSGAARALEVRDRYIGWDREHRRRNLPFVVNNSRYLLFPWVQVKHLASHVLGQVARRVRGDYERVYGFEPVLLETFVDPSLHEGTCYLAAGWEKLGESKGRGLLRPGRSYETVPRLVLVKPLVGDFREQLNSLQLTGRFIHDEEQ